LPVHVLAGTPDARGLAGQVRVDAEGGGAEWFASCGLIDVDVAAMALRRSGIALAWAKLIPCGSYESMARTPVGREEIE